MPDRTTRAWRQPEAANDILQNVLEFAVSIDSPPGPLSIKRGGGRGDNQWFYRTMRMYLPELRRFFHFMHEMDRRFRAGVPPQYDELGKQRVRRQDVTHYSFQPANDIMVYETANPE